MLAGEREFGLRSIDDFLASWIEDTHADFWSIDPVIVYFFHIIVVELAQIFDAESVV